MEADDSSTIAWEFGEPRAKIEISKACLTALAESGGCGVLFGMNDGTRIAISAHRELRGEDPPLDRLSPMHEALLSTLIVAGHSEPDLWGLRPVGWYRVRPDGGPALGGVDLDVYSRFFPEPWQILLGIAPNSAGARAELLARDAGGTPWTEPEVRQAAFPRAAQGIPSAQSSAQKKKNRAVVAAWILGALAGTLIAVSVATFERRHAAAEVASAPQAAVAVPQPTNPVPAPEPAPRQSAPASAEETARPAEKRSPFPSRSIVPAGAMVLVRLDQDIDTRHNQAGDRFLATLEKPVVAGNQVVIPKGTRFEGHVVEARRSGRFRGHAELGIVLDAFHLRGESYRIRTSVETREAGHRLAWLGTGLIEGKRDASLPARATLSFRLRDSVTVTVAG